MADDVEISVIIPVFNGGSTLHQAVESVLAERQPRLEVIILDDGSTDGSDAVIASFSDPRICAVHHPNMGLAATLNRGLALAKGRYVARQDQDDVVLPGRLSRQMAFLEAHPDVALLGTWARIYVQDAPADRVHRHPVDDKCLRLELLLTNPFVHSSVMIRRDALSQVGNYSTDPARQPPEDYELWSRIGRRYAVANLPEVLTLYREVPGSISRQKGDLIRKNVTKISSENLWAVLNPTYGLEECVAFAGFYNGLHRRTLSANTMRAMWRQAAATIGGDPSQWSPEFGAIARRVVARLNQPSFMHFLPPPVLKAARWLKRRMVGG